jgi:hypothetical protein
LDKLLDRRAWKESPPQDGHVYLFTLPARTWRASLQADLRHRAARWGAQL